MTSTAQPASPSTRSRRAVAGLAAALLGTALLASGCGEKSSDAKSTTTSAEDTPSTAAASNVTSATSTTPEVMPSISATGAEADVAFAQGMISHHQQAVEMSEIALDPARSAGPKVSDLATRIQAAQDPEIDKMRQVLRRLGAPEVMDMSKPHDMGSMEGMASADDIQQLEQLTGDAFDTEWARLMKAHHEGAVTSATGLIADGVDPELRAIAQDIVNAQTTEIAELEEILATS